MFEFLKKKKEKNNMINDFYLSLISDDNGIDYSNLDNTMLNLFETSNKLDKPIKLIIVCDTNNSLDELRFADYVYRSSNYDACILLGNVGEKDINIIKKYVNLKKTYSAFDFKDINNVDGKVIKINNISVLVCGKMSMSQKESIEFFNNKQNAEVLITYNNKYNDSDKNGFFGINYYIYKNKVSYHIHGSLLRQYKDTMKNGTREISTYEYEYMDLD